MLTKKDIKEYKEPNTIYMFLACLIIAVAGVAIGITYERHAIFERMLERNKTFYTVQDLEYFYFGETQE